MRKQQGRESANVAAIRHFLPVQAVEGGRILLGNGELLTPREVQVLHALWLGLSNREAARLMDISVSTVRQYVTRLRDKLELNRVRMALLWDQIARSPAGREVIAMHRARAPRRRPTLLVAEPSVPYRATARERSPASDSAPRDGAPAPLSYWFLTA